MPKKFTFTDDKKKRVVYERIVPNHISEEEVFGSMIRDTGIDPRVTPFISKSIRTVSEEDAAKSSLKKTRKRYRRKS